MTRRLAHLLRVYRGLIPDGVFAAMTNGMDLPHALHMVDRMEEALADDAWPECKMMRWLGWLQCLLAFQGLRSFDEMRDDTRDLDLDLPFRS